LKIADKLKTDPKDCLVFEDSDSGIESALSAGMYVIAINNKKISHSKILAHIQNFSALKIENKQIISITKPNLKIDLV
jgi:beta-phosphoglucomutase-like phosphatase (HAD superfamily)